MRYIQGTDRQQTTLLPEQVDDYIADNNPVRFIDAFVDSLDLHRLGFKYSNTKDVGRMPYNPGDLLKLYIYGYPNRIRSSRRLEKATHQNIEVIWLLRKLHPDFKTIADFRRDNLQPIKQVCREFTLLCKKLDLFGCELIAIDGSKFSAANSSSRNYTKKKLQRLIHKIDGQIDAYLHDLDLGDQSEQNVKTPSAEELSKKIERIRAKRDAYQGLHQKLEETGSSQVSLTDTDSRMMKTSSGFDVAYNVQIATDSKNKLIVDYEVTNDECDQKLLSVMAIKAKGTLGVDNISAVADGGYWERSNIKACHEEKIDVYLSRRPVKSNNKSKGLFTKDDFHFDPDADCYICPAGQSLSLNGTRESNGFEEKIYTASSCSRCSLKSKCSRNTKSRRIFRWVHEDIIEQLDRRNQNRKEIVRLRKALVEHPFGSLKHWMNHGFFLMRGKPKVSAEMALSVLSYNLKRALKIKDFKELMTAVT
jgi:transposase